MDITQINEEMPMPWQMDKLSKIYQFEFRNKGAYDNHKPFYIQFAYEDDSNDYKQVFFYTQAAFCASRRYSTYRKESTMRLTSGLFRTARITKWLTLNPIKLAKKIVNMFIGRWIVSKLWIK